MFSRNSRRLCSKPIDAYNAGVCKIQPDKSVKCVGRNLQKAFNDANTNDVMTLNQMYLEQQVQKVLTMITIS